MTAVTFVPELRRQLGDGRDGTRISIEDPEMRDAREYARSAGRGSVRSNTSLPSYAVNLFNEGETTATVERVEAKLLAYTRLGYCGVMGGGGDGEIEESAEARIKLPTLPAPGSRFSARLGSRGFQLPPGETDAIGVYFEMPDAGLPNIYALRLNLVDIASGHRQPIGEVIAATPVGLPGAFLPGDAKTMRQMARENTASEWCYLRNVNSLARLVNAAPRARTSPAVRRTILDRIDRGWRPARTPAQARAAALDLLDEGEGAPAVNDLSHVALAPVAAQATGDAAFARKVRRDAAALLVAAAQKADAEDYALSPYAAAVLDFDPTNVQARALFRKPAGTG